MGGCDVFIEMETGCSNLLADRMTAVTGRSSSPALSTFNLMACLNRLWDEGTDRSSDGFGGSSVLFVYANILEARKATD